MEILYVFVFATYVAIVAGLCIAFLEDPPPFPTFLFGKGKRPPIVKEACIQFGLLLVCGLLLAAALYQDNLGAIYVNLASGIILVAGARRLKHLRRAIAVYALGRVKN